MLHGDYIRGRTYGAVASVLNPTREKATVVSDRAAVLSSGELNRDDDERFPADQPSCSQGIEPGPTNCQVSDVIK